MDAIGRCKIATYATDPLGAYFFILIIFILFLTFKIAASAKRGHWVSVGNSLQNPAFLRRGLRPRRSIHQT